MVTFKGRVSHSVYRNSDSFCSPGTSGPGTSHGLVSSVVSLSQCAIQR